MMLVNMLWMPISMVFFLLYVAVDIMYMDCLQVTLSILTVWVFHNMNLFNDIKSGSLIDILCLSLMTICLMFFFSEKTLTFYILFELSLIPTLYLVFFFGYQPEKLQASMYLLIYTVISSLPLLLLFVNSGSHLQLIEMKSSFWVVTVLTVGFMVKTPMYLVHVWLPKAHVEAPVAGSMVLAGILLKLGSYGLIMFCPLVVSKILVLYLSLSVWGAVYCSMICLRQWDLKGLIAYSSVVHMGVVTVGVVSGMELGYSTAHMMIIAHGVCSPMLFSLAFIIYKSSHTRLIMSNKGSLTYPLFSFFLFLTLAINMGVPPSLNLWSEVAMFICFLEMARSALFFLIPVALLGAIYNLFMYVSLSQSKESENSKTDFLIWPYISSSVLSFFLFAGMAWFYI